jgi:hypothetical protein
MLIAMFDTIFHSDPFFLSDDDDNENDAIQKMVTTKDSLTIDGNSSSGISDLLASIAMMPETSLVSRFVTDGQGPTPRSRDNINVKPTSDKWEWDGTVDDDAHLDLD